MRVTLYKQKVKVLIQKYFIPKFKLLLKEKKMLILGYLRAAKLNSSLPNHKCLVFYKKVVILQRNIRLFLMHNHIKYWIINYQWSYYEEKEARLFRSLSSIKAPSSTLTPSRYPKSGIGKPIIHLTPIVPTEIRLFYIKEYCTFSTKKYIGDVEKWQAKCEQIAKAHYLKMAQMNAHRALTGQKMFREQPDLPKRPYLHIFIPKAKIKEMVRETLRNQEEWAIILSGKAQITDLPVLNKLTRS